MSTPVCPSAPKPSALLTPVTRGGSVADYVALRTPLRGNQELITRTPTPFKDALAEMEKKGGPINYIVSLIYIKYNNIFTIFYLVFVYS
jgi:hypothetical protein